MRAKIGVTNCARAVEDALSGLILGFEVLKAGLVNLQRLSGKDLAFLRARLPAEIMTGDEGISSCNRSEGFRMELRQPGNAIRLCFSLAQEARDDELRILKEGRHA